MIKSHAFLRDLFLPTDICSGLYTTMRAEEPVNNPGGTIMLQIEVLSPFKFLTLKWPFEDHH